MPDRNIRSRLNAPGSKFPRELTAGWSKPSSKFVGEMVWGIPASQDGKRSEIARSRQEEIPRIQTADRLSRNRSAEGREERRAERLAERGSRGVERNTVLGLDRSEVRKEYAPKRESLDPGWEGSAGEVPAGYWLCSVTAAAVEGSEVPPLPQELVAARAEGLVSANAAIVAAVDGVRRFAPGRGIWTVDRGGDRKKLREPLLEKKPRFGIRSRGQRAVIHRRQPLTVRRRSARCRWRYPARMVWSEDGPEKRYELR